MKLVSAVITTHNREAEIVERAVRSVLNQTYPNIEIIVVDDSSPDYSYRADVENSIRKIQEASDSISIKYVKHETCRGACAARNTGLGYCKGEIVGFLDDDDEWLPRKVEAMLPEFDADDVALVYCEAESFDESNNTVRVYNREKHKGKVFESLIEDNYIGSASFPLMKREAVIDAGGFDEELQSSQDFDMWLRIAQKHNVSYVEDVLVRYHIHEGEQITKNPRKKIAGSERLIEKNREYIDAHSQVYWIRHMKLIPHYLRIKEKKKAFGIWLKCVKKCPFRIKKNFTYLRLFFK